MSETETICILLVEDDALDRMAVERAFKAENLPYVLEFAETAVSAKNRLAQGGINLVLLDQNLPDGTGLEIQEQLADIPTIFMTGIADTDTAVAAMKAGAYDYLVKDVARDYLLLLPITIKKALKRKRDEDELARYRLHLEAEVQRRTIELQKTNEHLQQEITERKRAKKRLSESESKMRSIFTASPTGIGLVADRALLEVNERICEMTGYSQEELIGKSARIFYPTDEEYKQVGQEKYALIQEQGTGSVETCWQRKDGKIINVLLSSTPLNLTDLTVGVIFTALDITERVQAVKALRESEEKYRQLIDLTQEGIWVIDKASFTTFVNPSMAEMLGYSADEMMGKDLFSFMDERGVEIATHNVAHRKQGIKEQHDFEFLRKDGNRIIVTMETAPIIDEDGNYAGAIAGMIDITERVQMEKALRESEEQFRAVTHNASDAIITIDRFGQVTLINQATQTMFGVTEKELLGQQLSRIIPERYRDVYRKELERLRSGSPSCIIGHTVEFHGLSKDGNKFPIEISLSTWEAQGETYFTVIIRDITERKQVEEERRQLNQAIEQSPVSVVITDTQATIQYVNPKFSEVTGYSAAEAIGQNPRILQSGEQPAEFYQEMWETITAGREWQSEFHNRKKSGELYWEQVSITGVKDQDGTITHYVAVKEDITYRKQREEEHVRQERLAAVGQLSAGIAHDFNNVMAVITLYSELLQNRPNVPEKDLEKLQIIYQQARHAADLTQQVLDFSRRSVREPRPLDLKLLLNEMLKFVERTIPESVQVKFTFSTGGFMVNADPTQLQQVITNLTVNVRDALPQGGSLYFNLSRLTLSADDPPLASDMTPGEWVKLTIIDTGPGIAPDVLPHIFEPFFTTKEVGKGTGLGLAQVYGIVKQHEGCIMVESRLGEGTMFTIYLPALVKETRNTTAEISTDPYLGKGETILLVEDNQVLLKATHAVLESLNYHVLTAKDGTEALALYRTQPGQIDLILADVVMPKMDGFELSKALQQQLSPPKVLFMSGFPQKSKIPTEMEQFVSGWLQKPLELRQLGEALREALH